jgi:hypothetical protein
LRFFIDSPAYRLDSMNQFRSIATILWDRPGMIEGCDPGAAMVSAMIDTQAERAAMIVFTTEMTERRCAGKN